MMKKLKKLIFIILIASLLTSCTLPGIGGNTKTNVVVATGSNTERQILGEMVKQMIEHHTDLDVSLITNLSSSVLNHIAMLKGDVNVVGAMYTGTALSGELGMDPIRDPDEAQKVVMKEYYKRWNRYWYPSFGFDNTYAFMVTRKFAEENNLKKVSDLEKLSDKISVGVDTAWITREGDGYKAFEDIYGYKFKTIYPMDIGLVYTALASGEMDAVLGYSTDGKISSYDLVVLEDDKRLFPPYDCSPVASSEIIEKYPEVEEAILKLMGKISSETMQELNRQADEDLVEPQKVAENFLKKNNYFEDVEVDKKELQKYKEFVKGGKDV
ncbi:MAG: osmoprotectant ABC transporter substrate-binding protein [Peptoniphilus rhinitidis]|nr:MULTISPECIES: osmoprotectant ABC transporter substrate-binding protein [Peptoniphilus]MDU2109806.1 osmoprotectant ABC transporter substrate-binding protein [Peptoniphilus lacydonensis]MDU2114992.1 osmoprotectant ABC transporter substrate-binding protein [Peptoniphilus lacydonensis]MDU3750597.1 osmoprotectant ABC transporter substrate-binding protein [Peptoniphilus rhinitidis]MDU5595032.1 osmoprotectant ABC transporter substrate-binding protein [Peptoniphilus rhinitidis]